MIPTLGSGLGPARNRHRCPGGYRSNQEGPSIRKIGLNGDFKAGEATGGNRPGIGAVEVNANTELTHGLNGHLNVGHRGHRATLVPQHQTPLKTAGSQ